MKNVSCLFLFVLFIASCAKPVSPFNEQEVATVLDKWHNAAATANFDEYFGLMTENSIFMGTDATEYWTKKEFMDFSKPYFDRGRAWSFKATVRHIYSSPENPNFAWFDEELDTPNLGPSRGTGVLKKNAGEWKIEHYNLTVPIPNDIVDDVVKQIEDYSKSGK
jgi:ketosteroid isomerase-like protein